MRTHEQAETLTADPPLTEPFYVDQGALCLPDADGLLPEPAGIIRAIIIAAERDLYVATATGNRLDAVAGAFGDLTGAERGRLLVDLLICDRPSEAIDLSVRTGVMVRLIPDLDRLRAMPRKSGLYKDVYTHTLRVIAA